MITIQRIVSRDEPILPAVRYANRRSNAFSFPLASQL